MEVIVVPDAELQIRTIDGWWREESPGRTGTLPRPSGQVDQSPVTR